MSTFISTLTTGLSAANLWDTVDDVAPLIIVLVLFSLARRVINRNLKAAAKGKSGRI